MSAAAPQSEPSTPTQPATPPPFVPMSRGRAVAYMAASTLLALTQGLGMNLIATNLYQIQGSLGATLAETNWLIAAYMAPNVSLGLALVKIRNQYGIRNFAELSIVCFLVASLLNLLVSDLQSALVVRFLSGIAAAPLSSLAFLYMLEPFPPEKKFSIGLSLALTNTALGGPLARLISPTLLDIGGWHGLSLMEMALAMIGFGCVYMLPLNSPPRVKIITWLDGVSYPLIAIGFGATAVALALGRVYWWLEAPWLGWLLALGAVAVTLAVIVELNRTTPLIDVRWLASPAVLQFTAALLVFRLVLSEQSFGASNLFQALGYQNEQTRALYGVILLASIAGGLGCATWFKPGREHGFHVVALICVALGAFLDSNATNLVRPHDVYASQALVALGSALFLPPALASGLLSALKKGPNYILSFIVIFLSTQSLGGLLGSALFGTFIQLRTSFHLSTVTEPLRLTDPLVAQRVAQLGSAYGRVITDRALTDAEGAALLVQQATREATVLAYNDAFLVIAVLSLIALAGLLAHMAQIARRARSAARMQPLAS